MISGYHNSYTIPFPEHRNYINFDNLVKETEKNKVRDRLLFLDRFKFEKYLTDFLNEKIWPIYRDKLFFEATVLFGGAIIIDHLLLPIIGNIAHLSTLFGVLVAILLPLLRTIANIINIGWKESLKCIFSRKYRQVLIKSLRTLFLQYVGVIKNSRNRDL